MSDERSVRTIREAVGVFDNAQTLQEAIDDLMSSGFDRAELSLLAAEKTVDEKLGHKYRKIAELEDDPIVPRCCYVSTESIGDAEGGLIGGLMYVGATAAAGAVVATGGTLALVIAAAALAGGGGIAGLAPRQVGWRQSCSLSAGAVGSGGASLVGANVGSQQRKARLRDFIQALRPRRARSYSSYSGLDALRTWPKAF